MVASGVPVPRPDHALALASAASDMCNFSDHCTSPHVGQLQFRYGMNCGPVVDGFVGHTKFHYDIWGDPVNVASRMESHGQPGKIQITRTMYEALKDEFICELRGWIDVKGKGPMETWFLNRRREHTALSTGNT